MIEKAISERKTGNAPLISVVIPLYNKEKVVLNTLESVRRQTFKDYELVIVDDGSTDRSVKLVETFLSDNELSDQPIYRLIRKSNEGVAIARNRGMQEARGKYVAFLDADDEWMPEYLEEMSRLAGKYPDCDVFASSYAFKRNGETTCADVKVGFDPEDGVLENYFNSALTGAPPLWTSAVMVSKTALLSVGGFPAGMKIGQDIITWAKLACRYKIAFTKKVLAFYNRDDEAYVTVGKGYQSIVPAKSDKGARILENLLREQDAPPGLKKYLFLWHKMRMVMFVADGRKKDAFIEWFLTWPYGLCNLDCYYRLFLNFLPQSWQGRVKKAVGKY